MRLIDLQKFPSSSCLLSHHICAVIVGRRDNPYKCRRWTLSVSQLIDPIHLLIIFKFAVDTKKIHLIFSLIICRLEQLKLNGGQFVCFLHPLPENKTGCYQCAHSTWRLETNKSSKSLWLTSLTIAGGPFVLCRTVFAVFPILMDYLFSHREGQNTEAIVVDEKNVIRKEAEFKLNHCASIDFSMSRLRLSSDHVKGKITWKFLGSSAVHESNT